MTETLQCEAIASGGYVERYLARRLSEDELAAFESHFLTCDRCQQALVLGAGIRSELARAGPARRRPSWLAWGSGLGLAAAAGLAAILLLRPSPASQPLRQLGGLTQAPVYLGVPVRAGPSVAADSLFEAAMIAYTAERYPSAIAGLREALRAGVDRAPADFFLAASLLMTNQPREAEAGFARVIGLGDTPYLAEAHFYRAKALLRLGQRTPAVAALEAAARLGGVIGNYARALADSVARVAPR